MRVSPLALLAIAVVPAVAYADEYDDEDGTFVLFPKVSVAASVSGHGTRIDGRSESGFGPALELALGRDRWQYLVEGGFATAGMDAPTMTAPDARLGGHLLRGGLGARWLARQFRPDTSGAIELFLLGLAGAQRVSFEDGTRLTRPELALGVGIQGRSFRRPRFAFRLDARVLYTANDGDGAGFMSGVGVAW